MNTPAHIAILLKFTYMLKNIIQNYMQMFWNLWRRLRPKIWPKIWPKEGQKFSKSKKFKILSEDKTNYSKITTVC